MPDPSDEIDEVAFNVLLSEGMDVPTAWEASRRTGSSQSPVMAICLVVVLGLATLLFITALTVLLWVI